MRITESPDSRVMEIVVHKNSPIVNKPMAKINFPADAMIGAILRKGEMMVPDDGLTLESGDSVILIVLPKAIEKIEKLFGRKRHFFRY